MGPITVINHSIAQGKDRLEKINKIGDDLQNMLREQKHQNIETVSRNVFEQVNNTSKFIRRVC